MKKKILGFLFLSLFTISSCNSTSFTPPDEKYNLSTVKTDLSYYYKCLNSKSQTGTDIDSKNMKELFEQYSNLLNSSSNSYESYNNLKNNLKRYFDKYGCKK